MDIREYQENFRAQAQTHPWEIARFDVVCDIIKTYIKPSPKVIDIGSGDLYFLNKLNQKYNGTYVAVDSMFTDEIIVTLKNKYSNINLQCFTDIAQIAVENQKTDVVFLMDVLEHISDDSAFLKKIVSSNFVDDQTIFVITVPAFQKLFSAHDRWLEHYRRYSNNDLQQLVKKNELTIVKTGYFFFSLMLLRWCLNLFEKKRKIQDNTEHGISLWTGKKWTTYLYVTILKIDYFIIGKLFSKMEIKIAGLSTFVVCQKKK